MAVVFAIGAAMIIATPNVALAKAPVPVTEPDPVNGGITALITTTCENNGGQAPQSANCPEQHEEVDCVVVNKALNEPKGQQDECPE